MEGATVANITINIFFTSASGDLVVKNRAMYFFSDLWTIEHLFWIRIEISDGNLLFCSHTNVSLTNF